MRGKGTNTFGRHDVRARFRRRLSAPHPTSPPPAQAYMYQAPRAPGTPTHLHARRDVLQHLCVVLVHPGHLGRAQQGHVDHLGLPVPPPPCARACVGVVRGGGRAGAGEGGRGTVGTNHIKASPAQFAHSGSQWRPTEWRCSMSHAVRSGCGAAMWLAARPATLRRPPAATIAPASCPPHTSSPPPQTHPIPHHSTSSRPLRRQLLCPPPHPRCMDAANALLTTTSPPPPPAAAPA